MEIYQRASQSQRVSLPERLADVPG
jgi:hypothetical protein